MNIKDYFSFTRGEKRGVVVILFIITTLLVANLSADLLKVNNQTNFSEFEKEIDAFEKELKTSTSNAPIGGIDINYFNFNPNTISNQEWKKLGFKNWQVEIINNYKSKGGNWKTKSDVSKIYGLTETQFNQLKPYILLPTTNKPKDKSDKNKETVIIEYFKFNPNKITKEEWKKLGFKDWQIKTIFNYKAKGGSWKTKTDVQQIYGLNEADYYKLEPYILLPTTTEKKEYPKTKKDYTKKVNINNADAKELTNLKGIYSQKYHDKTAVKSPQKYQYKNAIYPLLYKLKRTCPLSNRQHLLCSTDVHCGCEFFHPFSL